jgi:hypothetical protein
MADDTIADARIEQPEYRSVPPRSASTLSQLASWHSCNLDADPVYAHWSAAAAAVCAGVAMAMARGAVAAAMLPRAEQLPVFAAVTRGAAPLYCVPFVLGTQLDCWETSARRRGERRRALEHTHSSVDLG